MLVSQQKGASRFGQRRPPLTELIRNILQRYPDGGQILKELIQNADDAGATEVNFLYDNRCHGTESLETPELANFQGPALYCHNNATFKEEDWEGIQNLMQSNKKDDPLKVGRFGIGFNSVYHITDLPGIVSGTTVGFLDPHETHFIDEDGRVSGKRYFFHENLPDHISRDQFLPFQGIFDCNIGATESYNGTLFRFPLRTVPSKLSKKNYTKEMVDNLFGSLRDESSVILLFLKSVLSISVHERNQDGEMECVFKVEVAEDTREEVKRKRQEFLSNAKEPTITESRYIMSIQVTFSSHAQRFRLLIVNQVGSNEERISELADELCLLPWVGMAVALDENNNARPGRIFCFLPLPSDVDCQTGLPIHVHGYFGLTDNRRGLVWPGADCQNTATAEWNELLLKKIAVEVYCKILEVLVQDVPCTGIGQEQRNQLVYGRLPILANVQGHWKVVLDPLFRKLTQENHKLFYAQHKPGNSWITLGEGILDRLKESGIASETREVILKILLNTFKVVITNVPPHVLEIVKKYFPPPQVITPALLRSVLKSQDVSTTPREDKVLLLDYVLRDDPTTDLKGVPLLPLANKQFTIFSPHNHAGSPSTSIFVPTSSCPATLLPNMSNRFLDEDLPETVGKKLVAMATNDVHGNNSTQLVRVTKEIVLDNLRSCLPSEWSNSHEKVQWVPGYSDHPPESWLKEIWHWIHSSFSNTLSPFTNVPLVNLPALPTVSTHKSLGVLSQHSKFIFAADDSCNVLPIQVTSLLTAAECTVLSDPPSYLRHPDINSYIAPPTPSGATSILCRASLQTVQQHIKLSTSDDRGILREFFSRLPESLCTDKRNFLLQLPLFDTLHGSCTAVQVNGQILNAASPEFGLPSGFILRKSEQIISSADPKAHQLLTMLNVEILKPAAVFVRYLFPDIQGKCVYNLQETSTIMLWILHQMFNYKSQCEEFHEAMTALPFVSTGEGELKKPSELYDLNDALLLNLFLEEANKFPSQDYADGQVISALKELGLRTRSMLTSGELLGVAVSITTSLCSSSSIRKVQALVEILESNPAHLNQHVGGYTSLKDKLLQLKWLPCAKTPPNSIRFPESMPWFNSVTPFFAPAELRSKSHALLVGTSMPILDVNMDESLQEELGLTSEPPIHQVVAQLKTAVQVWQQQDQKKATSLFQEMIIAIYLNLSKKSKESVSIAINDASLNQWIWHGTGFCSPTQVALEKDFPLDLRPQLFLLPEELNDRGSLTDFFFQHGVRQKFLEEDIISVLPAVREKHTSSLPEAITTKEIESDLKLCRSILEWLVEDGETLSESLQEKVLVPVQSTKNELILEPCKSCTYCDRDWLRRGGSDLDIPGDYQLIHELVPTKTAKLLGVSALSGCLLSAETLDFEFEQTGPHEPLTTRLSNILKEYKEGVGVFKELIQNADDAGASKVRFLVDWRHGPKEKLLSPDMEHCQGPALWAYNNSVFTDKDFENINKLAGATKVEDFAKIGRFGLGFNAVYHLTDVPSFVSREYLVIFDPNVHHLQSHIKDRSRPGIRIDLAKNPRPLTSFEDQFQPYHGIFDCNTQCREGEKFHCDGTLFRFPFRTLGQADKSEICQNVYDKEKVKTIVGSLRESASLLLLYTQHVNEVELYELAEENNPQMMKLVLSAKKNVPQDTTPFIKECSDWWRAKLSSADTVPNNPSRSELITIDIKETASDLVANTEQSVKQDTWLVSSCVGTDSSARLALGEGREHGLLPCAGAAAKLLISEDGKNPIPEGITGEAFCFLPLSIATGLPVHINSYFSITSNRRGIWERSASDQSQPIEVQWNESLMEDALSNAYIHLLEQIKALPSGNSCCFHKLWPRYETLESSTWGTLVKSVYSKLVGESLPLLWSNGKWLDIHSGYILDTDLREAPGAVETLGFLQENVFDLTTEICSTLKKSGHEDTLVSRTLTLKDFFRKFFFPNITKIPLKLRDPIVSFGLDRIFKGQDELIPLFKESAFVSTDEGELKKSSELYDPNDVLLLNLFLGESNKFPTKDFASENVISTLKKLGLQTRGMVAAMELLKVANTISLSLNSPCSTTKVQALVTVFQDNLAYLNEFVDEDETLKVKLLKLKWLPRAKTPPESCRFPNCMPWFNSDAPFFAPTELCIKSQALLVGASMPTLDIEMDNSLEEELGLTVDPPLHLVIAQLNTIVQVWQQQDQKKVTLKIQDMLTAIYQHLSKMSRESIDDAINAASLKQWIWHGTGFCSPAQMALEKDFSSDLRPHLFLLPEDLEETGSLTEFFLQHGVRQKFTEEDIISVLTAVKDKHASLSPEAITSKEIERDSKLCRSILEWLVEDGETLSESLQEKVLVPVQSSKDKMVLEPCKNCTYCDRDWLRHGGSELDIPGDYQLIHESVPTKTAKLLGVPALSACLLSAETLDFVFEQTGPHEPLTTRLSNILKEYKEGVGVFKELIQNADDAGASKVRFLVDWRHGPKEKLLSPGMVDCQGPALWAYNNSTFTDKDFENINKLAGATKVEDFAKIGRFGLGFNAVYHLTDVPSFVSREYLVIFDPNVHHLQSHIKDRSRPGIRINLAKNPRPLTAFEDQFQPYHGIFDCNTQCREGEKFHCNGTLFRFPFRTLGQANKSEICQNIYDKEKVKTIVGSLRESASLLLLYTQHVNEVELYELAEENNPQMMKLVLSAKKSVPQDTYNEGSVHTTPFIKECSDWWRAKLSSADTVPTNPSRSELITIDIKETASDLVANTEQSVKQDTWLVSSCVGTDSSARLALGKGREHGLLPCAGAAAKLSKISEDEFMDGTRIPEGITGEAFCFLPLSIATGLPVHINSYFSITSNRRGIWERSTSDQCEPIEVQWNESLMEDALSNAYIHLLEQTKPLSSGNSCCFHKLWPRYETLESSTWGTLVKSVYSKLVGESLPLLFSNGKWLDIHSGYILDEDLREAPGAVETLGFLQENVFDLTTEICSTLKKSGHEDTLVSRTLTLKDFFRKFFFPNITKIPLKLRDPIVSFGLDRIFKGQDELIPLFKESAFVSTDEGELKKSSELYDPNDVLLLNLFLGESNKFPTKDFASENVISTLKKLGLQTRGMVTAMELLKVAETISSSPNSPFSTEKVQALVTVLQDNPAYLNEIVDEAETMKVKLLRLKWLPCAKTAPESCRFPASMPWFNSDALFFAPTELRSKSQALLIGSSMPILDIEMDKSLQEELDLTAHPPVHCVVAQLNTTVQIWKQQDDNKVTSKFQDMLTAIYQHLSKMPKETVADAINAASLKQWIWHGTGFCSPTQIALKKDFPFDLRPHLFLLPQNLEETGLLTEFFLQHGVRQTFSVEDIILVLATVKDKHASSSPEAITSKEIEMDLKICRSILEWLVEDGKILSESLQEKVLVPVQSTKNKLVLELCNNCTYCDQDWLRHGRSELDIPGDYQLIHESVPTKAAKLLGVPALSTCLLSAETLGFEQTGPHEPLTTRLSNILKEYKEGVGVFKELIQNADDAGASKVRFLVDWRHGPKEKLLSPDMEHCQGPALWAYNNSVFTDKDFENINKLAGATKVDDLAKIGRFGLGFNAVYHLTDVPSFVSREYLVIFDPNVHHLQSHIKDRSRPGIRINLAKNPRPLTSFEDQFQPYHGIFDCNTQCREGEKFHCNGTLFRFPFRTLGQANKSEICQNIYDKEKVKTIVGSLRKSASLLLLYTQHVNEVELYELAEENNPQMMKLVLSAKKSVPQDTYNEGSVHTTPFIKECSDWWRAKLSSADTVSTSPSRSELITIDIKETVSDLVANTEQSVTQETWLVSSCVGTDSSARLALGEGREHGLLPCAGAAAKLSKVPEDEMMDDKKWISEGITGEAFCFLPLSIATGLPVHINGYFAITSNRRRIWERSTSDQSQPIEVQWNESLMEDALSNAYIHLLETMKYLFQEQSLQRYYFHELWPCYGILKSSTWETLVKSVYSKLVGESLPLLFSNGKWLDIHSGYILDEDLRETPGAVETLAFLQENVFDLTADICSTLKNSGQEDTLQSRTMTLENFLKGFFFPNITKLPQKLRDPIVCFGLDRIFEHKKLVPFFKENACIRCSDDGVLLAKPCDLIHPEGAAANLFAPEDNRFPVGKELLTSNRLYVLEELGMVKDMLSWEKICERAKSVEKLQVVNYEVGLQRVRNLINYLNKKIEELPEKDGIETTLRKTKFLPFKSKSPYKSYALPWKGAEFENPVFHSPEDLFLSRDADLVGSCVLIVDDSNESGCGKIDQKVKKLLGFSGRRIHNDHVLLQLDTAIKTWAQLSEEDKKLKKSNIASVCKSIYKHIDDFFGYAVKKEDCEKLKAEIERLKGELTRKPWLFVDGTFVSSDKVSKEWTGRGAPFLYGLPEEFCDQHKNLLQVTEVKKCFDETDFLNAVSLLRVSKNDSALTDYELSLAVCFLNELRNCDETFLNKNADRLLLPDNKKILSKAAELTITDTPWLTDRGDARYVHKDITADLAFKFGAKSLRDRRLKKYSKTFGTPFGQHEKLTDRLKNILKSYLCDSGILKELVQNADDAKATEIHFVYDTRTLPHKQVFQTNAQEIQGPALCVYNDRYFSDEDLQGIQKLGIGSKSDDPEKTGQYGVGFNAVYHLTDCPSFLSNDDTLCLLDPHCRYAPEATPEFPGEQFSPVDAEFKEDFSDTLSGYLGDHFELKGCTMFRLPLRNRDRSQSSLISEIDASTEIQKLLEDFRYEAKKSLLFLNHVKKISISKIDNNGEFKREYEVSSIIDEEDESKRHNISLLIKEHKDKPTCDIPWQGVTYPMILSDSNAINEEWLVHQCFGSNLQNIDDANDEVPDGQSYGLLPRGGVAALVSSNRSSKYQARHVAYCFLPLPVYTSLPVHVNGHFALDPARRELWKDTDETKPLVKWNSFMKSHVLAPGYASLILDARNYMPYCEREPEDKTMLFFPSEVTADSGLHWYHKLFPDLSKTKDEWKTLAVAVYRFLGCTTAPVLPLVIADEVDKEPEKAPRRIRRWLPAEESFFLNKFETPEPPWKVLLQIQLPMLVSSPLTILDGFLKAEITPSLVSPESVINALRDIYSDNSKCNIGNLPSKIEETLIRSTGSLKKLINYCQKKDNFASLLIGLPLLLTADGILRDFDANYPVFCSKFSDLFPKRTHQFVHPELHFNYLSTVISGKEEEMPQVLLQLTASSLATFMPDVFPASMRGATKHLKFPEEGVFSEEGVLSEEGVFSEGVFSEEWLKRLWQFLQHHAKPEQDKTEAKPEQDETEAKPEQDETEAEPEQDETGSKPKHVSLDSLKEWPIVPTKCKHLVTIGNAKTVLDMTMNETESEGDRKVRECLEKLCCPSLDTDITYTDLNVRSSLTGSKPGPSYFSRFISTITGQSVFTTSSSSNTTTDRKKAVTDPYVAHPHSVADVLQVLDYMRETDILDVKKLSEEEIFEILKFVQNGYESLRPKENYNNILKKLALYKSINKSHYSLSSFSSYAIVPDGVPTQEIEKLQIHTGCLFLHSDALPTLTGLLEGLDAGAKRSVAAFYIEYILGNFSIFSYESQLEYLTHIRDDVFPRLCEQKEKEDFLYNLKGTACIPTPNGQLRHASEFYDPRNKVFRIMLEENSDQFPPSYFNETKWLKFLTNIGLQSDVNQNVFSKFCDKVASAGNRSPQDETNRNRSKELVRYLLTNHHLHESSFLSAISNVKFIASEKVESNLLSLYKQYQCSDENQHPPFLQFSNSVPWKYRQLVWTSASLLPECDQLRKEIPCESCKETCSESFLARLGIQVPSVHTVVGHLQNICGPLAQTSSKDEALPLPKVLETIMISIYEFFKGATACQGKEISDDCNINCKSIGHRLKTTPCVLVENNKVVVRGDQLSFKVHPEKSLQPFLYAVPREYGSYEHILKRLGATEEITSLQLANVFKTMKDRCQKAQINPEYESKASDATFLFFKSVLKESGNGDGKSKISELTELYLPSECKRLIKSNELLCKVPPRHIATVAKLQHRALLSMDKCGLSREQEDKYLKAIPEHLRPKPFNKVVKETLDPSCLRSTCQLCRGDENCDFIEKHMRIVNSKEFRDGIVRLLKHQKTSSELTEEEKEKSSRFGSDKVEVKCMETIKVHLVLEKTNQPLENSSHPRYCYVVKERDSWIFYIQHDKAEKRNESFLSVAINKILDWCLEEKYLLVVAGMLSCDSPSEIAGVLTNHDIQQDFVEEVVKLGREVPVVFHYLMQQNPLFVFHEGELVAFRVETRDESEENAVADAVENEDGVKYVLVKIISRVTSSNGDNAYDFKARYLIDLGNEKKEVSVLDLYKFYQNDPDENPITDMVLYTGDSSRKPTNLDEAKREIREALRQAWLLPPEMRRKVIRRLYLRWHPDKNPNNVEFATEMMAFLLSEIKRLQEEEERLSENPVHCNFEGEFKNYDDQARRERETYRNYSSSHGGWSGTSSASFSATSNYTSPNPREASRWLEQSENDLEAAQFLLTAVARPFNALVCFLSHQIVEKSLKAALYAICGLTNDQLHTHDTYSLAQKVSELNRWPYSNLVELAVVVGNYYLPTRYPNRQPTAIVPCNAFSVEQSTRAVQSAKEVLTQVKAFTGS